MKRIIAIISIIVIIVVALVYFDLNQNMISFHETKIDIKKTDDNYIEVKNSKELFSALNNQGINIINVTKDIDLGYNLVEKSNYIEEHTKPLAHPTLKKSGFSKLLLKNKKDLVITSSNQSRIYHASIIIDHSNNIKIDNLSFKELWEWDEDTYAEYRRNDWDIITVKNSNNVVISNNTFSKAYDGIVDIKESNNVTISNNSLDSMDINDAFFNAQFDELEKNIDNYSMYKYLREEVSLTVEQIKKLSLYHYKLFLIGTEDHCPKNENIVIHDNRFLNVKTRIPQARNSSVYFYNNYIDSSDISNSIVSKEQLEKIYEKYPKLVYLTTYGIISIQRSYIVSENNTFKGVDYPYTRSRGFSYSNIGIIKVKGDNYE